MRYGKSTEARSPYHRHGKKPFVYSPAYQHWHALVLRSADPDDVKDADEAFRKQFGIPMREDMLRQFAAWDEGLTVLPV